MISEIYILSLNENYIFCVKSNIQIDNKFKHNILLCCLVLDFISDPLAHTQTGGSRLLSQWKEFDWLVALVKSQRKAVSCSLRVYFWERLAGLYRWNVFCFTASIPATEALSLLQREGGSRGCRVKFDQYLLKDVMVSLLVCHDSSLTMVDKGLQYWSVF